MKSFEEYLNLDGKDALESPIVNSAAAANPEERFLPVNFDIVNSTANVSLNGTTIPTLGYWDTLNPLDASAKDSNAMDFAPQMLTPMDWLADFMYAAAIDAPSPALPLSAQLLATPCETPALLETAVLEQTSPEFNNSPLFAPPSTSTSPAWKTSPPFGTSYSPAEQLGLDDPIVALAISQKDSPLSLFPTTIEEPSSSSSSAVSHDVPNLELLLRSFTGDGTAVEPTVSVPMSVLRAMVEHMSKCTCGQPAHSTAHSTPSVPAATATSATSSSSTLASDADAFASRRRRVPNKLYLCSHTGCGKTFTRRFNLQTHESTHNPNRARDHVCEMCAKKFTRSHDLTRHMTVHAEEKHECEGCGKGYSRSDALRRHAERCEGFSGLQKKMVPTLITLK